MRRRTVLPIAFALGLLIFAPGWMPLLTDAQDASPDTAAEYAGITRQELGAGAINPTSDNWLLSQAVVTFAPDSTTPETPTPENVLSKSPFVVYVLFGALDVTLVSATPPDGRIEVSRPGADPLIMTAGQTETVSVGESFYVEDALYVVRNASDEDGATVLTAYVIPPDEPGCPPCPHFPG